MKIRFLRSTVLAATLAAALTTGAAAVATDLVKSADIVSALTSVPKAVQTADGRWLQRDPSIDLQVQFDFNKTSLTPTGEQQLDELANAFRQPALAGFSFEVAGHTDKVGTAAYNLKLSTDRANSTRDYLVKKHGIAVERIVARGYGFDKLADAAQPTAAINRRVEIRRLAGAAAAQPGLIAPAPQGQALPQSGGTIVQRPQ
jgi:OmpA-OmpF porin, OOP family